MKVRRSAVALMAGLLAAGGATACSSTAQTNSTSANTGTFTIGVESDFSLNPATSDVPLALYPAYDTLVYQTASGAFQPDLAVSWKFIGSGNTVFQLTLRKGLKFTDGSPLTGAAAAASLEAFLKEKGPAAGNAGPVSTVTAPSKYVVQIHYSQPMPEASALFSLTQGESFGMLIGPKAVSDAGFLNNASDGIGPYKLDPAATTPSVQYTYVANPDYFNKAAIKYSKVVVKPIVDATTRLNAVTTGQIDYAFQMPTTTLATARSSHLQVIKGGGQLEQLLLEDRKSGPLSNLKVRQAIASALDGAAVIHAVFGGVGTPISSLGVKGFAGYVASDPNPYPYDLQKAKSLMASAGYGHGFALTVLDAGALDPNGVLAEAIASQLQAIGITVHLNVSNGTLPQFFGDVTSGKYETVVFPFFAGDIYTLYNAFLSPGHLGNGYSINDPVLDQLLLAAASAPTVQTQDAGLVKVTQRIDQQAWSAPIALVPDLVLVRSGVEHVPASAVLTNVDPFGPFAALAWQG